MDVHVLQLLEKEAARDLQRLVDSDLRKVSQACRSFFLVLFDLILGVITPKMKLLLI